MIRGIWMGIQGVPEALPVNKKVDKFSLGLNPVYDTTRLSEQCWLIAKIVFIRRLHDSGDFVDYLCHP